MTTNQSGKSVHCFKKNAEITDEIKEKVEKIVAFWDGQVGPFGSSSRLSLNWEKDINDWTIFNESGCIIFSYFPNQSLNTSGQSQNLVDLGFKLYNIELELEEIGISTCISTSFNDEKATSYIKKLKIHLMEFEVPVVLYFGFEDKNANIFKKFISWFYSDSYRLPLSSIVIEKTDLNKYIDLFEAFRHSPSSGNSQTWRVIQNQSIVHFYTTSELGERYINIGCAVAAFCNAAKQKSIKGHLFVSASYPKNCYEYIISWEFQ
ncbi:hypothetical protein M9Y10_012077 [Tritrichomonas musculus]|uniref:Putative nitroreductase TM1586 domain-containing protein n=1 Tax=Tritrichomonas musculus TaxID=1915356 RepID=A0ABR2ID92_9EUKA